MLVTVNSANQAILNQKTRDFEQDEFGTDVERVADTLLVEIQPLLPCAGLAAPQIGISRSIFLYTYDRNPENLTFAINPRYEPIGDERQNTWEGCLSVINSIDCFQLVRIPRYAKIRATYFNRTGQEEQVILEGFAAKVFQHEYDHLQGLLNIKHPLAEVKTFSTKEELLQFSKDAREQDKGNYKAPQKIK